jgi:hypothetical protein
MFVIGRFKPLKEVYVDCWREDSMVNVELGEVRLDGDIALAKPSHWSVNRATPSHYQNTQIKN